MSNPREALTDVLDHYSYLKTDPELVHFCMLGIQLNGRDNIANCLANTLKGRLLSANQIRRHHKSHRGGPSVWQELLSLAEYHSQAETP